VLGNLAVAASDTRPQSLPDQVRDLVDTTKAYALQETWDPLKNSFRFLGFGVAGSLLMGLGSILLILAGLRALQTQTGPHFTGHLSWIPYVIVFVVVVIVAALVASRIGKHDLATSRSQKGARR
jgi:hypothetical protein